MLQLVLSEPTSAPEDVVDKESIELRISLLKQLESVLWSLIISGSGGRLEARLWLHKTVAGLGFITPQDQCDLFMKLLKSKRQRRDLASQLIQMMFDRSPQKGGYILSQRSYILERFFQDDPRRVFQWFENSPSGSRLELGKGVKALSHFSFRHRDICWDELVWKGKHGQSPAMVATKPHYFLDLDIERTVGNFLEHVPEFWSSDEFANSLRDGEILFVDKQFFVKYFVELIHKEDARDLWQVIEEFLMEQSFSSLCQHLLIALEEEDLSWFLELLSRFLNPRLQAKNLSDESSLFKVILSNCSDFASMDQILILNAVLNQGRQLIRLLRDDEAEEERERINSLVSEICAVPSLANGLASIVRNQFKMKSVEVIKYLGLQCWVLYYQLAQEFQTPESWKSLFIANEIGFRKYDKFGSLATDGSLEQNYSDFDHKDLSRKKPKAKRKRKRTFDLDKNDNNEMLRFDAANQSNLESTSHSWLLSTDGYSTPWTNADLPEHLYRHCLSKWLTWFFTKWS